MIWATRFIFAAFVEELLEILIGSPEVHIIERN